VVAPLPPLAQVGPVAPVGPLVVVELVVVVVVGVVVVVVDVVVVVVVVVVLVVDVVVVGRVVVVIGRSVVVVGGLVVVVAAVVLELELELELDDPLVLVVAPLVELTPPVAPCVVVVAAAAAVVVVAPPAPEEELEPPLLPVGELTPGVGARVVAVELLPGWWREPLGFGAPVEVLTGPEELVGRDVLTPVGELCPLVLVARCVVVVATPLELVAGGRPLVELVLA